MKFLYIFQIKPDSLKGFLVIDTKSTRSRPWLAHFLIQSINQRQGKKLYELGISDEFDRLQVNSKLNNDLIIDFRRIHRKKWYLNFDFWRQVVRCFRENFSESERSVILKIYISSQKASKSHKEWMHNGVFNYLLSSKSFVWDEWTLIRAAKFVRWPLALSYTFTIVFKFFSVFWLKTINIFMHVEYFEQCERPIRFIYELKYIL